MKIFPCENKQPTISGWQSAAKEEWNIEAEQWGAPCGEVNGFIVVDVDKKKNGLETATQFDWGDAPKVETPGGGYHIYYKYDAARMGSIGNRVDFLPGIDLRTNGGYVILYSESMEEPGTMPEWLLTLLAQPPKKLKKLEYEDEVGEGGRNHFLARAAGRMQKIGVLTLSALNELNEEKCKPPLDDYEVELIFNSISRYIPDSTPQDDEIPTEPYETAASLVGDFISYLSDDKQKFGEPTGIAGLDDLLGGGLRPGELVGVLAQGKSGKSALTHKIIHAWVSNGTPCGYASRELRPATEVLPNLFSINEKRNVLKEPIDIESARETLAKWPLFFSRGFGLMPIEEIKEWCTALKSKGVTRFVFDHLHHFCGDEDYKVIAMFSRAIKQLMMDLGTSGIMVIQPKQLSEDQRISFNMIRGGSAVAQAIDALITLERQRDDDGKLTNVTRVKLDIARHKLARLGEIYLAYDKDTMDFNEVEPIEETSEQIIDDTPVFDRTPSSRPGAGVFNQKRIGIPKNYS